MSTISELRVVSSSLTREQKTADNKQIELKNQLLAVKSQTKIVKDALQDKTDAKAEMERTDREYRLARKASDDWDIVCYSTFWIPFVGIGTCIKALVEIGDNNAAVDNYNSRARTYDSLKEILDSMVERKNKLTEDLESLQVQLQNSKQSLVELSENRTILQNKAQTLSQLGTQIRNMVVRMKEIVAASNTFSVRDDSGLERVKTLLHSLSISMKRNVAAIKRAEVELCISRTDLRKLEAAANSFILKVTGEDRFQLDL